MPGHRDSGCSAADLYSHLLPPRAGWGWSRRGPTQNSEAAVSAACVHALSSPHSPDAHGAAATRPDDDPPLRGPPGWQPSTPTSQIAHRHPFMKPSPRGYIAARRTMAARMLGRALPHPAAPVSGCRSAGDLGPTRAPRLQRHRRRHLRHGIEQNALGRRVPLLVPLATPCGQSSDRSSCRSWPALATSLHDENAYRPR